ncbi:hypothetical protein VTL71DRAFT_6389 [Oculimacula yallundae]|uniref:Heterokaryon incompatibility domain-containing protein n=1 Tax=Oculimacula yallundae TaxID=86028 RepID=A0ABR4BZG3_9HELO
MSQPNAQLCPNLIARISSDLGPKGFSYWINHGGSQISKSHTECHETRCYANDDGGGPALIRHLGNSCSCQYIGPELSEIISIIDANMIPVIAVEGSEGDSCIIVKAYTPELAFTAISHARSLGDCFRNPTENKLPTCLVRRIQTIVANLSPCKDSSRQRKWFWIDTLCVPSQHLLDPRTRRTVMDSMKSISQKATQTIVIDSDISLLTSKSSAMEVFIHIAYSSWSSRFWTLQEAVYANRLLFHFSDQIIDLEDLIQKYRGGSPGCELPWSSHFAYKELRRYLDNVDGYQVGSEAHCALLLRALEGRATSNKADEPIVIANLLGTDSLE